MTVIHLSTAHPHFLLVDDDDQVAAVYRRVLAHHGVVTVASSVTGALVVIETMALSGVVSDFSLPDGTGIDVAARARARSLGLEILLISGAVDRERLRAAHELRAAYLQKPVDRTDLDQFAERAVARQQGASSLLVDWVARYRLTAAETVTMRLALQGLRRDEIAQARGVRSVTVRNQIASLVTKTGSQALAESVAAFYRELARLDRWP